MIVFEKIADIQQEIEKLRKGSKKIGFVPTMGALHEGHITLVDQCAFENNIAVVSIFVNPIQFNNQNDLNNYPRTLENDLKKLEEAGCDYVFVPSVEEMYPEKVTESYNFGELETVMEGKFRPGHFNGVGVVVKRLFDIITPHRAYFGMKDYQQVAVIKSLVKQLNYDIEIVECATVREPDGLAMSSRNLLLSPERRKSATLISKTLFKVAGLQRSNSISETKRIIIEAINNDENLEVEYFELVDSLTLQSVSSWDDAPSIIGCIAVQNGNVRLIDNMTF